MLPAGKHVGRAFSCLPLLMLITAISGKKKNLFLVQIMQTDIVVKRDII